MGAQTAQEPSMEDILASIRKIIAEDDQFDALDKDSTDIPPISADTEQSSGGALLQPPYQDTVSEPTSPPQSSTIPPVLAQRQDRLNAAFEPAENNGSSLLSIQPEMNAQPENAQVPVFQTDKADNEINAEEAETLENNSADSVVLVKRSSPIFADLPTPQSSIMPQSSPEIAIAEQPLMTQNENADLHPAIKNAMAYRSGTNENPTANVSGNGGAAIAEKPVFESSVSAAAVKVEQLISPPDESERRVEERRIHPLRREADMDAEFGNALMSVKTDETVAGAFEKLKNSATQNLDTDVQEMLRPMLREWLDSNLPSMVERLVRDEIERVSRGE